MTEQVIRLPRGQWMFDDARQLGRAGGFGEVFRGTGPNGDDVAVKRLKLKASEAAHRELDIAQYLSTKQLTHVVPVLDAGQDTDTERYFIVMPVCERNLQSAIDRMRGRMSADDAILITNAILLGLQEVAEITHRDLKPENVLFHNGVWKIADFGIAKFVEDSTSLQTLRTCLTPAYAAPEQWLGERPTGATDVYALGCVIYSLLTGAPPFGYTNGLREKHFQAIPPGWNGCPRKKPHLYHSCCESHLRPGPAYNAASRSFLRLRLRQISRRTP